jgi:MoaA/NifB/PqqE/SkfB family radical SAM enzyme
MKTFSEFETMNFKYEHWMMQIQAARALFLYRTSRSRAPYPKLAKFDITYRCDLRCKMCFYWNKNIATDTKKRIQQNGPELTSQDIKTYLIPQLNQLGLKHLTITGGEPLQKEGIYEILDVCGKQPFRVNLNSNLYTVGEEQAERLAKSGISIIQVSLDGPQEIHNKIRGKDDAFQNTTEAIKHINAVKRNNSQEPHCVILCTVIADNYRYLTELLDIAKGLNTTAPHSSQIRWRTHL